MTNTKFYITSVIILIFILGGFYFLNKHFNQIELQNEREYELTKGEQERAAKNDTLARENTFLRQDRDRLLNDIANIHNQKQVLYINNVNKTKGDISKPAIEQNKIALELIEK